MTQKDDNKGISHFNLESNLEHLSNISEHLKNKDLIDKISCFSFGSKDSFDFRRPLGKSYVDSDIEYKFECTNGRLNTGIVECPYRFYIPKITKLAYCIKND